MLACHFALLIIVPTDTCLSWALDNYKKHVLDLIHSSVCTFIKKKIPKCILNNAHTTGIH